MFIFIYTHLIKLHIKYFKKTNTLKHVNILNTWQVKMRCINIYVFDMRVTIYRGVCRGQCRTQSCCWWKRLSHWFSSGSLFRMDRWGKLVVWWNTYINNPPIFESHSCLICDVIHCATVLSFLSWETGILVDASSSCVWKPFRGVCEANTNVL